MKQAWKVGLQSVIAGTIVTFAVVWLVVFLSGMHVDRGFWLLSFFFGLVVGILAGLFAWLRAHIAALSEQVTMLSFELDKLKKKQ